jgi:Flp pilus assembly pilin Flp
MRMFRKWIGFFRRNDLGQDLAEYCLMTAIIALIGFGIFYKLSGGFQNLWGTADSAMASANTGGSSGAAASTGGSTGAAIQSSGPVKP